MIVSPSSNPNAPDLVIDWDPPKPRRPLTAGELREFHAGRDAAAAAIEAHFGVKIVVRKSDGGV